jgi:hypothetical protein
MADFGDWEPDDALDHEPPDPEQVTYRMHRLRVEIDALAGARDLPRWEELSPDAQAMAQAIGAAIVAYVADADPDRPEDLARALHDARRFVATTPLAPWDDLAPDDRQVGIDLMAVILGWLAREGALS